MKKLIILIGFLCVSVIGLAQGSKPVFQRTPDGPNILSDANLKISKYLIVPISSVTGIPGGSPDSAGYFRYNPSTKQFEGYYGTVKGWQQINGVGANVVLKSDSSTLPGYVTNRKLRDTLKFYTSKLDSSVFHGIGSDIDPITIDTIKKLIVLTHPQSTFTPVVGNDILTKTYGDATYQPLLVSGTNIKTINSNSLLGSGNIVIPSTNLYNHSGSQTDSLRTDTLGNKRLLFKADSTYLSINNDAVKVLKRFKILSGVGYGNYNFHVADDPSSGGASLYIGADDGPLGMRIYNDGTVCLGCTPNQAEPPYGVTINNAGGSTGGYFGVGSLAVTSDGIPHNQSVIAARDSSDKVAPTSYVDRAVATAIGSVGNIYTENGTIPTSVTRTVTIPTGSQLIFAANDGTNFSTSTFNPGNVILNALGSGAAQSEITGDHNLMEYTLSGKESLTMDGSGIVFHDAHGNIGAQYDSSIDSSQFVLNPLSIPDTKWVLNRLHNLTFGHGTLTGLTGDGTASGTGSVPFILATVNSSPGTYGDASHTVSFTDNGKGLVTASSQQSIQIAESQVTSLSTDLASKLSVSNFVYSETPSGLINGSNTSYTLANTPVSGTVRIWQNGQRITPTTDYTISGSTITMITAPLTGDTLLVDYNK